MEVINGIILRTRPLSDSQKILHVFSREEGFISFVTPTTNKARVLYTPMLQCEIEFFRTNHGDLNKLRSLAPNKNCSALFFDVTKSNIAMLWGYILDTLLRKEEQNLPLFDYLCQSVNFLESCNDGLGNFNLIFLYRISSFIGFKPDVSKYRDGYLFNLDDGTFINSNESSATMHLTGPNSARAIFQLCNSSVEDALKIPLDGKSRGSLLSTLLCYYELHLNTTFDRTGIEIIKETLKT